VLVKIFAPGFFAHQNTRTPVRIGIIAMISNMAYNIILVGSMMLASIPAAHTGLALATALSANQNAIMLYQRLKKDSIFRLQSTDISTIKRALLATSTMALVILLLTPPLDNWLTMQAIERGTRLAAIIAAAVVTYTVTLIAAGFRPGNYSV